MSDRPISKIQLDQLETVLDKVFGRLGIDIEFTRHFLDRVNDERNRKQITMRELGELFKKEYIKWGRKIATMPVSSQAVMKDLSSELNIPFVLRKDGNEKDLVAKTIMRKKDFKTPNTTLPVESVEEKHGAKKGTQVKGKDATPAMTKPSRKGQQPHPMRGKLVGETSIAVADLGKAKKQGTEAERWKEKMKRREKARKKPPFPIRSMMGRPVKEADPEMDRPPLDTPTLTPAAIAKKHGVPLRQIAEQLKKGIKVEMEHTTDSGTAREIALDHLMEMPNYYTKLAAIEPHHVTSESVRAAWEQYQVNERVMDPREAILRKALAYLDKKIQNDTAKRMDPSGHAFDIARSFNVGMSGRQLFDLWKQWKQSGDVMEAWLDDNLPLITEAWGDEDK